MSLLTESAYWFPSLYESQPRRKHVHCLVSCQMFVRCLCKLPPEAVCKHVSTKTKSHICKLYISLGDVSFMTFSFSDLLRPPASKGFPQNLQMKNETQKNTLQCVQSWHWRFAGQSFKLCLIGKQMLQK